MLDNPEILRLREGNIPYLIHNLKLHSPQDLLNAHMYTTNISPSPLVHFSLNEIMKFWRYNLDYPESNQNF